MKFDFCPINNNPCFGVLILERLGYFLSIVSLSGQIVEVTKFQVQKIDPGYTILLTVDACTLNLWAKSSSNNPSLILIRTIKTSCRVLSFRSMPGFFPRLLELVGNAGNSNSSLVM